MSTTRRGFLKLMSAAIATPVIARLSLEAQDTGLITLPDKVELVQTIEPAIVQSGAASFARANRIYCMPGMVGQLSDHVRVAAMSALPGGTHFQIRAVPMTGEDRGRAGVRRNSQAGVALMWVSESDVTPNDSEYELVGRFMVPKRELELPPSPNSIATRLAEGESLVQADADPQGKWVMLSNVEEPPPKRALWDWLRGKA